MKTSRVCEVVSTPQRPFPAFICLLEWPLVILLHGLNPLRGASCCEATFAPLTNYVDL